MAGDYHKLKKELEKTHTFPIKYMYKFILPAEKISEIEGLFEGAEISTRPSKKGNYISLTAVRMEKSADDIVAQYQSIPSIKGMISL